MKNRNHPVTSGPKPRAGRWLRTGLLTALALTAATWADGAPEGGEPNPRLAPGLFDASTTATRRLADLHGETTLLYQASAEGMKYSHHSHLGVYGGQLYAMWSAGPVDEDSAGQHVVYCHSADGRTWSAPQVLVADPDGPQGPLRATAGGWLATPERLVAYYSVFAEAKARPEQKWSDLMRLEAVTSADGTHWSAPQVVAPDFLINEAPRPLASGRLLMTGENQQGITRLLSSTQRDGLSGWLDTALPRPALARVPNEPSWFATPGGGAVMLFRDDNASRHLYAASLSDAQTSWTLPRRTDYPDATAKARAGNFPDGTVYLISNPLPARGRGVLACALSDDGRVFDRGFILRDEPTRLRYPGRYKDVGYQYPGSLVHDGWLYVIYSINKEDVAVSRVALAELAALPHAGRP